MPALAPNAIIAITGITGYIASHVGLAALQAGHRVRGTVRSLDRAKSLKAAYINQGIPTSDLDSRLEFVVVDDLLSSDQWLNAIKGVDGVVHVAVPLDNYRDRAFIGIAIETTLSLLRAAKRVSTVQRVVITSSASAVVSPPVHRDKILTVDDWNDETVRIVENDEPMDKDPVIGKAAPLLVYATGKTKAEKAAWEFVHNEKPHFDLVTTLPYANFGPVLHGEPPSTAGWIAALLKNDPTVTRAITAQWFVDVRDDGRLHLLGLTTPALGGKRIWAAAAPFGWNQILTILRKHFPSVQVPENFEGGGPDTQRVNSEVSRELLGGWIGLEKSVVDQAKSLGY